MCVYVTIVQLDKSNSAYVATVKPICDICAKKLQVLLKQELY